MDIVNELQYLFGTKDAREGNLTRDKGSGDYEPNLLQRALGVSSDQLTTAAQQGEFNRFGQTAQGQDAKRYGVEVTRADMGNLGGLQDRIDEQKAVRTGRETLTSLGYTGDVDAYTTRGGVAGAINTRKEEKATEDFHRLDALKHNSKGAVDERNVRDRRYYADRQDAAQSRIDLLQSQMRADRRADQRHNESMERLDRQDHRKAISGMTGGLTALAAAFAM